MSSQRGNVTRSRSQKHQNSSVYKNNKYGATSQLKKANAKAHDGICQRCKDVIEWKIKYNKYKPLSQPRKCLKTEVEPVHTSDGDPHLSNRQSTEEDNRDFEDDDFDFSSDLDSDLSDDDDDDDLDKRTSMKVKPVAPVCSKKCQDGSTKKSVGSAETIKTQSDLPNISLLKVQSSPEH
uniref:Chromosome 9 open reading frame 85 n=1 Tax=Erpetoichthys calabaricus TaxID=27687 RepID=A0A8C4X455_ERPCA